MGSDSSKCCRCDHSDKTHDLSSPMKDGLVPGIPMTVPMCPEEKYNPKEAALAERPKEFTITLTKSEQNDKLGVNVDLSDTATLLVENIGDGLIADWNDAHPELEVCIGDRIIEVNGTRGDAQDVTEKCVADDVLKMVVSTVGVPVQANA